MIHFVGHAFAATEARLRQVDDHTRVAIYGRGGRLAAALCVNAPHVAARLRGSIAEGLGWEDAVAELEVLRAHPSSGGLQGPSNG